MTNTATIPPSAGAARRSTPELALVAWTLFVWVGRLRNIATDDALNGWGLAWRTALAASFVGLALALAYSLFRRPAAVRYAALALAGYGIVVWTIRGIDIALSDHSAGFIAVHTVLAVVTIALSVMVGQRWRSSSGWLSS